MWLFLRNSDWKLQPGIPFSSVGQERWKGGEMHEASILGRTAASHFWGMMGSVGGRGYSGKVDSVVGCSGMERFFMLIYRIGSNKANKIYWQPALNQQYSHISKDSKINLKNIQLFVYFSIKLPSVSMTFYYINIYMIINTILIILFGILGLCQSQTTIEFQIRKRHPKWSNSVPLGKLLVKISQEGRSIESEVEPYHNQFLTEHDFEDDNPVILEFAATKSNAREYQDRLFVTAVDEINSGPHGQKIVIVTGSDPNHLAISAINYVQTRDRVGQIYTENLLPREELSPIFGYVPAPPKNQQEEESFFSKYKWPLIIGGVLLFTMSSQAPEQPQQAAAPRN